MAKELFRSLLIYGLGTGLSQSILIFLVPIYTRYFSQIEFGALEIVVSMSLLIGIVTMLQMESAVGRFYFEYKDINDRKVHIATGFWGIAFLSCLICGAITFLSGSISQLLFSDQQFRIAVLVAVLTIPFANLYNYLGVLMRYEKKPLIYIAVTFLQLSVTVVLNIILIVKFDKGIESVFVGQMSGYLVGLLLYLNYFRNDLAVFINFQILKKYLRFSLPMTPAVLSAWGSNHANRFVMISFLSLGELGIFMGAYKVASVFKLVDIAFRMAWNPYYIEYYKKPNAQEHFKRITILVLLIIGFLVFLSFLFGPSILILIAGSDFEAGTKVIGCLSLSFAIVIVTSTINIGPVLMKKTIFNTYSYLISMVVNISFLFLLVPRMGILGAAISLLLGNITLLSFSWHFSERLYPVFTK